MAGKATGERINGSKYRQIVQLAISGEPINQISKLANVSWRTADVVVRRESKPISERKLELADACYRVAYQATERLEDNLDKIPPAQLATVAGIMTDKVINLTAEPINNINQHLHVHLSQSNMIEKFNELVDKINGNPAEILTLSAPSANATSCQPSQPALSCVNQNVTVEKQKNQTHS